jgi:hypothetical protein
MTVGGGGCSPRPAGALAHLMLKPALFDSSEMG